MKQNPRKLALDVLDRLERSGELLDPIMEEVMAGTPFSDSRDRSLFHSLVFGVLRWRGRLDWIIGHFSKTPLKKIDPIVMNVLRLGLFQVVFLDRIPVSAAVNTSVSLAKTQAPAWLAGFVNALLRNAAKNWAKVPLPDSRRFPDRYLAVRWSFPSWMVGRWISRFGFEEAERLCRVINEIPPITIRTNTLKTTRPHLLSALHSVGEDLRETPYSKEGICLRNPSMSVHELPLFEEGGFQVQDEAAQLVSLLLDAKPGQTVLDACAGLGVKTGHIAQLMENRGTLFAVDKNPGKVARLEKEMQRLGVTIVRPMVQDLQAPLPGQKKRFDRILLDAPCSGLGVVRRNPDAKWRTDIANIAKFAKQQQFLLNRAADLVSPHGILVYSVCSTEPEENEAVIDAFLKDHPMFVVLKRPDGPNYLPSDFFDDRGFFRTYPHRHGTDGFFAAALKRNRGGSVSRIPPDSAS
ncbi:MAG: 16S rRNA (cytosine(967)-C(5))-methyltransferase RsmB [Desulfobacterales bacterium]|nr:16S rRNA (cytosine(967)-C(5))-methyltransferase RsmB [Desulfobacterales bacterium]